MNRLTVDVMPLVPDKDVVAGYQLGGTRFLCQEAWVGQMTRSVAFIFHLAAACTCLLPTHITMSICR